MAVHDHLKEIIWLPKNKWFTSNGHMFVLRHVQTSASPSDTFRSAGSYLSVLDMLGLFVTFIL